MNLQTGEVTYGVDFARQWRLAQGLSEGDLADHLLQSAPGRSDLLLSTLAAGSDANVPCMIVNHKRIPNSSAI
jgi:hypothetical protein